jgi:ribonuclease VapC
LLTVAEKPSLSDVIYVLDASALMCAMLEEPGADRVAAIIQQSFISAVNLSEVVAKFQERGASDEDINDMLKDLTAPVVAFTADLAVQCGKLRAATRHRGLSLGDRACLAAAKDRGAVAVTTDRSWQEIDVGVKVMVVR